MRAILLDWLTDVHQSLGFDPSTFYRTAHLLDLYLMRTDNVSREKLQLVGVTAFMMSAKLSAHAPPPASLPFLHPTPGPQGGSMMVVRVVPEPDDCAYWTDNGE